MKDKYGADLEIKIFTTDSEEAKHHNFKSSTNVLLNGELLPLDVATDRNKLARFLAKNM